MCDIRKVAYSKFQFWWMGQHGYSIEDLFSLIPEWLEERDEEDTEDTFSNWFFEVGFNGEIYPCFDEFLDYEYQDNGLMKTLLTAEEYRVYRKDRRAGEF